MVYDYKGRKFNLTPIGLDSERHERGFIVKRRRMHKGDNRPVGIGWCAVFTYRGKRYKSGGYYSKAAAIRWGCDRLDELGVDELRPSDPIP